MVIGYNKPREYPIQLVDKYRMFMFGDFGDTMESYDWIDMALFLVFSFMTMIMFTNILIAYMGDAHEQVKETMEIVSGQGTAELLVELETLFAFLPNCFCCKCGWVCSLFVVVI